MNWGHKILFVFTGFVFLILVLVFLSYRQEVPLVAEDYYQQELKYQEEIDMLRNARSLTDPMVIETDVNRLIIHYPSAHSGRITGNIRLMRPSDPRLDTNFAVKTDESQMQVLSTASLRKGLWKIKIYWEHGARQYMEEKDIIIQ